ncbi:peptidase domain-containing ABC transporter [Anaerosacchariphilus polymeriproducens]|uniref:Peptidase domain-containing ABC transporter n=1 Tax=Anaerosacchariphilus polymeriproducens TaxID=1812858 RepID=A0A371AYH8_9FIRM|nr:peptidase domain-containing ABC transporter [Anaerosacchariphilus polymeriproducens]RDU24648.1 peptidase domain-containing ABC transporter [Anaerosacchariphilus polymeriproducens]
MKEAHMKRVPYIQQMRQTECGLCCVAMIMQYYKSYDGIRRIRESLEVGRDGLKISLLSKYMKSRGMETKVYRANAKALEQLTLPAIIFWHNEHFVVLEKLEGKSVTIVDPAFGRRKIKYSEFCENYSDIIMVVRPTEKFKPYNVKTNLWINAFRNIKIKKSLYLKLGIASAAMYFIQMIIPVLVQHLTDNINGMTVGMFSGNYYYYAIGIAVLLAGFSFFRGMKIIELQLNIDRYLTKGTFKKMLNLPYKFFESRSNGDLLFRLNCLSVIRDLVSEQIIQGVLQVGMMLCIMGYMLSKSIILTGVAVLFLLLNIYFIIKMKPTLMEANQNEIVEDTRLQGVQVEAVYSAFGIKIAGMENEVLESWTKRYKKSLAAYKKKNMIKNINDTVLSVLQMAAPLIILSIGIFQYMDGFVTIGEVIAIYTLAGNLFSTGISVFNIYNSFVLASSYLERITDITDAKEEQVPDEPIQLQISGNVQLKDVSFSYTSNSENVLNNINLDIKKGQKVAIVGASGSGKSTLAKIILGLYEPKNGEIYFDGVNMKKLDRGVLRRQIGVVPQDMSLFNKTIYDNICVNKKVDNELVRRVAQIAQIDEEIQQMPMKYQTLVSDMGMNLSGGQRQRIVLARALLNRPELMILDEATSALDYVNEKKVTSYFQQAGCTRIIIAHRLSTIIDSDIIIVLERGRVVESGTHEQLIKKGGLYANLYISREQAVAV